MTDDEDWWKDRKCMNCRFWVTESFSINGPPRGGPHDKGKCWRYPPGPGTRDRPEVYGNEWCGEFMGPTPEVVRLKKLAEG